MKKRGRSTRRVLIVESGSLLDEGVETLLRQDGDLQVSGVAYHDDESFLQDLSDLRPDVILMNAEGPLDSVRILELLKSIPTLATLRVIVVRPDENDIDLIERQRVTATRSADLINLIRRGED